MSAVYFLKAIALFFLFISISREGDIQLLLIIGAYTLVSIALYVAMRKIKKLESW